MSSLTLWPVTSAELRILLHKLRDECHTDQAFARILKISATHVNRILQEPTRIGVRTCLQFARVTGADTSKVLRATNKKNAELADLLDDLYGRMPARDPLAVLTDEQHNLLLLWSIQPANVRVILLAALERGRDLSQVKRKLVEEPRRRAAPAEG